MDMQSLCVKGICTVGRMLAHDALKLETRSNSTNSTPVTKTAAQPGTQARQKEKTPARAPVELASTAETVEELKKRLGKELYKMELDLANGGRINNKPCDCLSKKHRFGLEATAEELMSYEHNPVFGQVIAWLNRNAPSFEPTEIAKHDPEYYRAMIPQVRAYRKEVMGTEHLAALLNQSEKQRALDLMKGAK